ncbi:MAG: pyridoxamine 5'-phosphate oxidase family protein [Eubacteriales bacterium]|nr:pyridoxamine 5'-phosphate oxidase family protein [Eubacteriales bacterium]
MAKLTDDMKAYFGKQLPMISTVSAEGKPNIGPKRTLRIYDDETLIYNENTGKQTLQNIKDTGKAAVALVDWDKLDGYRFCGHAEAYTEGEYFDACCKYAEETKGKVPKAAVVIKIEEIYTLKIGPTAGTKIS